KPHCHYVSIIIHRKTRTSEGSCDATTKQNPPREIISKFATFKNSVPKLNSRLPQNCIRSNNIPTPSFEQLANYLAIGRILQKKRNFTSENLTHRAHESETIGNNPIVASSRI